MDGTPEARLQDLGIVLPDAPSPVANYVPSLVSGDILFISGQISMDADGKIITGQLGNTMSVRIVEVTSPPMTTTASGFWMSAPEPVA